MTIAIAHRPVSFPRVASRQPASAVQFLQRFVQAAKDDGRVADLQGRPAGAEHSVSVHLTPGMHDEWTFLEQVDGDELYIRRGGLGPQGAVNTWSSIDNGPAFLRMFLARARRQDKIVRLQGRPPGVENANRIVLTPRTHDAGMAAYVLNDRFYLLEWSADQGGNRWSMLVG